MKKALIITSISLSIFISFVIGVNIGFTDGYAYSSYIRALDTAFYNTISLRNLRENEVNKVIILMEAELDSAIIEHEVSRRPSIAYNLVPLSYIFDLDFDNDLQLFNKTIKYRKQYPSTNESEEIRKSVHSHLSEIENKL